MSSDHSERPQGPIARVPPDVLLEIFDACRIVNDATIGDPPSSLDHRGIVRAGPPAVTAVCQSWRNLAIHTPILWTDVHIQLFSDNLSSATGLLRIMLSRSARRPLSISMRSFAGLRITPDAAKPIINVLLEQCTRWANLDVCVSEPIFHLLLPAQGHLAQLRSVRFRFLFKMWARLDWAPLRNLFSACPALVDVEHWGPPIDFPWEQLDRLSLMGQPRSAALERTTHARVLHLMELPIVGSTYGPFPTQMEHPRLQKLTVARSHRLRCFRAPTLTHCHIIKDTTTSEDLVTATNYFRGEGVKLTTLSISVGSALAVELGELFAHCRALEHLQLGLLPIYQAGVCMGENEKAFTNVLSLLVVHHERRVYLPALRRLGLMMSWVTSSDEVASVYEVVQSRATAPDDVAPCLETFVLRIRFGLQHPTAWADEIEDIEARLQSCRLGGKPTVDVDHGKSFELCRLWREKWTML
ncbi:hypothetical protein GGG16DRAFT_118410 [Schizophyllum commune]